MPRHLLVDVDSTIPNFALMKIATWCRQHKIETELLELRAEQKQRDMMRLLPPGPFDRVWVSTVFDWNKELAHGIKKFYEGQNVAVAIGGSGYNLKTKLSAGIENLQPDYSLYDQEYVDGRAMGFLVRGCIRACQFCIVNRKEGWLGDNPYHPLESWVPEGWNKIILLDNEFAAMDPQVYPRIGRDIEGETLRVAKDNGWKISISQGYDVREVTPRKAARLAEWKPYDLGFRKKTLYIAFDYVGIEPAVKTGVKLLIDAGFKPEEIVCYVLVGFGAAHYHPRHEDDWHRAHMLWHELGVRPFIMKYNKRMDDPFLNEFARYWNLSPANFRNHSFVEYCEDRHSRVLPEALRLENQENWTKLA